MINTMQWCEDNSLKIIDQTKLPNEIVYIICRDYKRVGDAIKKLEVRGAPAIGAAAAYAMVLGWNELLDNSILDNRIILSEFEKIKTYLDSMRPTAINLFWGTKKIYDIAHRFSDEGYDLYVIQKKLLEAANIIYNSDILINKADRKSVV